MNHPWHVNQPAGVRISSENSTLSEKKKQTYKRTSHENRKKKIREKYTPSVEYKSMLLPWNEATRYPSDSLKEKSSRRIFLVHRFHYLVTVIAPGSVSFVANTHVRGPRAVWGRLTLQTRNAAGCGPGQAKRDPRGKPLFTKNERERERSVPPPPRNTDSPQLDRCPR